MFCFFHIFAVSTIFCFAKITEEKVREEIVKENLNQGGTIMEQFSLEKYLANPERKIVTRDGRPVRIICTDRKSNISYDGPILALVEDIKEGREYCYSYSSNGKVYESESEDDLFFAPEKHTDYINLYRNEFGYFLGGREYNTEEEAKKVGARVGDNSYITTIKAEWEE